MARKRQLQTTFIAGELAPELSLRVDTKQYNNGAKSLLNRRCLIGGGTARRPGTRIMGNLGTSDRLIEFVFNENEQYIIGLHPGGLIAFLPNASFAGFSGGPWDTNSIPEMDWMQTGNTIIFTHFSFKPFVVTRLSPTTWDGNSIGFFSSGPRLEQPYYKLAPHTVTLLPSGYTGSITVQTSVPWLTASHIG